MSESYTVNADRGEVGLTLDGRVYPLLPTFAAANAIETQIGAISTLVARLLGGSNLPTFRELAIVATECMRAAGRDRSDNMLVGYSAEKVGQLIYDEGLNEALLQSFTNVLANMVSGGTKKKAVAAAAATSESPTGN